MNQNGYKLYVWNLGAGSATPAGDYHTVMFVTLAESLKAAKDHIRAQMVNDCKRWAESMAQVDPAWYDSSYSKRQAEIDAWLEIAPEVYPTDAPMFEWVEHTG